MHYAGISTRVHREPYLQQWTRIGTMKRCSLFPLFHEVEERVRGEEVPVFPLGIMESLDFQN